ncbi:hypothetical protein [uncultured Acetatifactor sp.]|jgi:hypothetical protein|uniref:hypothetical protein n=1 Tax=uncultured Acetatifactor sp. TaxID=1671927 RepID=UPI0026027680|nr:hypothetical protein [uncultured Acetatifactor sp.]
MRFVEISGKSAQCVDRWEERQYNKDVILPLMYRRIELQKAFMCERNEIQRMKWEKAKEMDASSFPFLMYDLIKPVRGYIYL